MIDRDLHDVRDPAALPNCLYLDVCKHASLMPEQHALGAIIFVIHPSLSMYYSCLAPRQGWLSLHSALILHHV